MVIEHGRYPVEEAVKRAEKQLTTLYTPAFPQMISSVLDQTKMPDLARISVSGDTSKKDAQANDSGPPRPTGTSITGASITEV